MYEQKEKSNKNKSREVANSVAQKKSSGKQGFGFVDNRPEAVAQRMLQEKINGNTTVAQLNGCYKDVTDRAKISAEIESKHLNPEASEEVVQQIFNICWETDKKPDVITHWLELLKTYGVRARKWSDSNDIIEIYPSGTHGDGKHDRLWLQVSKDAVGIVKAYKSEH